MKFFVNTTVFIGLFSGSLNTYAQSRSDVSVESVVEIFKSNAHVQTKLQEVGQKILENNGSPFPIDQLSLPEPVVIKLNGYIRESGYAKINHLVVQHLDRDSHLNRTIHSTSPEFGAVVQIDSTYQASGKVTKILSKKELTDAIDLLIGSDRSFSTQINGSNEKGEMITGEEARKLWDEMTVTAIPDVFRQNVHIKEENGYRCEREAHISLGGLGYATYKCTEATKFQTCEMQHHRACQRSILTYEDCLLRECGNSSHE